VDISVLVQDARTGEMAANMHVAVRLTHDGREPIECEATTQMATNKLLRAALFDVPEPGQWHIEARTEGPEGMAVMEGDVEIAERLPRWREIWPWVGWPALALALIAIHEASAVRQRGRRARARQ
jgi:hypothetical protein